MLMPRDVIFDNLRHFRELLQARRRDRANISAASSSCLSRRAGSPGRRRHAGSGPAYPTDRSGIRTLPVMVARATGALPTATIGGVRMRAELLRDGGHELIERLMDELGEAHLGLPLSHPDRPRSRLDRREPAGSLEMPRPSAIIAVGFFVVSRLFWKFALRQYTGASA